MCKFIFKRFREKLRIINAVLDLMLHDYWSQTCHDELKAALKKNPSCFTIKGVVHFQNNLIIYSTPCHPRHVHVFLSLVGKKLRFLRKSFQDFSPYRGLQQGSMG